MAVNARGPWLVMRAVARASIDAGRGCSTVATSSVSAHLVDRSMDDCGGGLSLQSRIDAYGEAQRA